MWLLLLLLSAKPNCAEGCNAEMAQCSERCGDGTACVDRCNRRLRPCTEKCAAIDAKADAAAKKTRQLPCGTADGKVGGKVVYCTGDEEKKNRELLKQSKGGLKFCKNESCAASKVGFLCP